MSGSASCMNIILRTVRTVYYIPGIAVRSRCSYFMHHTTKTMFRVATLLRTHFICTAVQRCTILYVFATAAVDAYGVHARWEDLLRLGPAHVVSGARGIHTIIEQMYNMSHCCILFYNVFPARFVGGGSPRNRLRRSRQQRGLVARPTKEHAGNGQAPAQRRPIACTSVGRAAGTKGSSPRN